MESSAAVPGFGKIWSWLTSSDRDWDLSLNIPFFGSYQALNPHFFSLAVQIKDTWPFLTFHSIRPGKNPMQMLKAFGCPRTLRDGWMFSPRGKNPWMWQIPTPPSHDSWETVSRWVFGDHGYSRLLFLAPAPLGGAFISIHLLEWFAVSGHGLLERPWSALFISSKRIII